MDALSSVLEAAKMSQEVKAYIRDDLGLASLEDFVCVVAAANFEAELKSLIIDNVPSARAPVSEGRGVGQRQNC